MFYMFLKIVIGIIIIKNDICLLFKKFIILKMKEIREGIVGKLKEKRVKMYKNFDYEKYVLFLVVIVLIIVFKDMWGMCCFCICL